jgi:hypothetical protein
MYRCSSCKKLKSPLGFYRDPKNITRAGLASWCRKCEAEQTRRQKKAFRAKHGISYAVFLRQKSIRAYFGHMAETCRHRAKIKGWDFQIATDILVSLWQKQNGICALSGIAMTRIAGSGRLPYNVNVDRKDSSKGYIPGNVQLVCSAVNSIKSNLPDKDFVRLCKAIARYGE